MIRISLVLFIVAIFSQISFAQNEREFNEIYSSSYRAPGGNYNKVKVKFTVNEGENIQNIMEDIENAMKVRDPNGVMNPYWIVAIPDKAFWKNDGVIIGTWYTDGYAYWSSWISRVEARLKDMPGLSYYKIQALGQ